MGCVSSKHIKKDTNHDKNGYININHVVSLTSSTLGALKLDNNNNNVDDDSFNSIVVVSETESKTEQKTESETESKSDPSPKHKDPETVININAWELMEGLEEGVPISNLPKKSPKSAPFLRGFLASDTRSPMKFLNQFGSPKTSLKKPSGKENKVQLNNLVRGGVRRLDYSPKGILKPSTANSSPKNSSFSLKGSPFSARRNSFGNDSVRKSPRPLFDPEIIASYEKELSEEGEQIKRIVFATPKTRRARKSLDSVTLLNLFEKNCPPGGENSVVIYTTTLRGIRKTFEDCNKVRSIIESYCVCVRERDVSMDSGFKEELKKLMGMKQVQVPVVFVKGRFIGGVDEVVKLEDEEKLGVLLEGIPKALGICEGCGDLRFVMCKECNGSCKVLDEKQKKTVKCGYCNENGIIRCSLCC
ncbi:glutaredoxin family protein [Trifolium pratense]|uniref:Glutaredoxin family protein n=1 Tax=Trifolium pratense TaxID=57577 RepID=A0A2K3L1U7_TRIPR|nr:glutaredoxin family protein [Trifolium pratense]